MGEGAGTLVVEDLEHARKRNAHIYGELIGYGCTNDAYHVTASREDGEAAAKAMGPAPITMTCMKRGQSKRHLAKMPMTGRQQEVEVAMSNSFGFGGHNSILIFKKYKEQI